MLDGQIILAVNTTAQIHQSLCDTALNSMPDARAKRVFPSTATTASTLAISLLNRPVAIENLHYHNRPPSPRDLAPFNTASALDERPSLPSIGLTISRPSSATSQSGAHLPPPQPLHRGTSPGIQLPGVSSLASLAGSATSSPSISSRPPNAVSHSMTYATSAPATSGGQNPPICQNCTTSTTPLWRRDEVGSVLCNACGLFLKLHGRPRPISLKTDVIKSRNRVKTSGQGPKKKQQQHDNGLDQARAAAGTPPVDQLANHHRRAQKVSSGASERSTSPLSRTGTPNLGQHHPSNIAPQHMFDGVTLNGHEFHSPSLPSFMPHRQPSPSASSVNGSSHLEPPMSYDGLATTNTALKTRVSELEVINDLFRGRVTELEQSEQRARQDEAHARDHEKRLQQDLDESHAREAELKRRVEELEAELAEYRGDSHRQKRMRLSDLVESPPASTPLSTPSQSN
ncbi:putative gata transcription factor protein [Lasiodiplodia theobromae]|uniref:GATA type zinc finger protein asd-4 n=2 Tax=Lasiodiplodia TaxID=66739 RepID=A0A5N5D4L2_9PEZI|nr:GATA type zinc finger protein asd-4 [Lasiodiplodia theobromae]KAF9638072.1 putative gata transcription factor protein [Lasiodiplodia theobromae]KAK0628042.1 GATA type zinc finger protein asd-4 [Lasiodiplodia hormozganensis]